MMPVAEGDATARRALWSKTVPVLYLVATMVLCSASIAAIRLEPFDIGTREFDLFLGQIDAVRWGRIAHSILFLGLGGLYLSLTARPDPLPKWLIPSTVAVWFLSVPWINPDVFYYLAKGWIDSHYGLNAYTDRVTDLPGFQTDPIFASVAPSILSHTGNYGPRFHDLSRAIAFASNGSPVIGLFLFKAVGLVALRAIELTIRQLLTDDGRPTAALAKWLWLNPLILATFVGGAHNDVYLVLLMLLAARYGARNRAVLAGFFVGLAIAVKLAGLFIAPVIAIATMMHVQPIGPRIRNLLRLGAGSALGLMLGFGFSSGSLSYFAAWADGSGGWPRSSIFMFLQPLVERLMGLPLDTLLIGRGLFLVLGGLRLLHLWRSHQGAIAGFITQASFEMLILAELLTMKMMNEWYLLWPMAFGLARAGRAEGEWIRQMTIAYMPVIIWAIVGSILSILASQFFIAMALLTSVIAYFRTTLKRPPDGATRLLQ